MKAEHCIYRHVNILLQMPVCTSLIYCCNYYFCHFVQLRLHVCLYEYSSLKGRTHGAVLAHHRDQESSNAVIS